MLVRWQVITLPKGEPRTIALKVDSSLAPLRAFFFEAPEEAYPRLIEASLREVGAGFNSAGVIFPNDLDEDEEAMASDMVEIYDPIATVQIPKRLFWQILLNVAQKSLFVRRQRREAPFRWKQKMQKSISKLRAAVSDEVKVAPQPTIPRLALAGS
jgi:hypothetical protein